MADPLTALANIISTGVGALTKAYSQNGLQFPSLDDPFQPAPLSIDSDPSLVEHKALIAAAAAQILAMVRPPVETFLELSSGMYGTATCSFVVDTNIPDILKEAGPAVRLCGSFFSKRSCDLMLDYRDWMLEISRSRLVLTLRISVMQPFWKTCIVIIDSEDSEGPSLPCSASYLQRS